MQVLSDNGDYVLTEGNARLTFYRRSGLVPRWMVYVPGLLTGIFGLNTALQAALGNFGLSVGIGIGAVLCGLGLGAAARNRREHREAPLETKDALAVIDFEENTLRDGAGELLSALDGVAVKTSLQLTSSARKLELAWPGGSRVVYRGDPFLVAGSIDPPARALAARGFVLNTPFARAAAAVPAAEDAVSQAESTQRNR